MKIFILTALMLANSAALLAAPVIGRSSDIKFNYRATGSAAWEKIYAVAVIYPQMPFSVRAGAIFNDLKRRYPADKFKFFALLPVTADKLKSFAAEHSEFDFTLISDVDLRYWNKLLGRKQTSFFQTAIFNCSGKLLWNGDPVDLDMMLKRIADKKYSEREEVRISALTGRMQAALRSGNAKLISESADEILKLRPEQISAVNAKAYSLELAGNIAGLEQFYRNRIDRYPEAKGNYFTLINTACRIPELNPTASEIADRFIRKFPGDTDNVNAVLWSLLNELPYDAKAFKVVLKHKKLLDDIPEKTAPATVLMTRSLTAYRQGKTDQAEQLCKKAVEKTANPNDDFPKKFLEYLQVIQLK